MSHIPPVVAAVLRSELEARRPGWTLQRWADVLGVQRTALSRFLSGEVAPSLQTAVKIASRLGISVDALCGAE